MRRAWPWLLPLALVLLAWAWVHRAPPAAPVADLRRVGSLTFAPCRIGRPESGIAVLSAYCTRLDVPEDWSAPSGRRLALRVALVPSALAPRPGAFAVWLDGGPGGAATEDYPVVAAAFGELARERPVLLMDQRGTGGSNRLACPDGADKADAGQSGSAPGTEAALAAAERCLAELRTHAAPEHYATGDAARDLEALRTAIGSPRLDVIGVSYGTRLAQQYAAHYPAGVRSLVLDSAVPNRLILLSEHARNLERALERSFERCRLDKACAARFGDPAATLARLRARLAAGPVSGVGRDPRTGTRIERTIGERDLAGLVRLDLYSPLSAALLPLMLDEADHGRFEPLLGQAQLMSDDLGAALSGGLEMSVLCTEDADALRPRAEDAATLFGNRDLEQAIAVCAHWPHDVRATDFHEPLRTPVPTLVLAGTEDPVTPPAYGEQIVHELAHARLLLARGQGHGVLGAGCMPKLVARFLDTLDVSALDDHCLAALGQTPAFLDFNGAGP